MLALPFPLCLHTVTQYQTNPCLSALPLSVFATLGAILVGRIAMATEASLIEKPADKLVEEVSQPKAEIISQGDEPKMENLSSTHVPVAWSEGKTIGDNKEIASGEVKLDEVKTALDDISEKKEASGEIKSHQKHEESTTSPESQANRGEGSASETPKDDKISNEFRTNDTAGEGSEVVEAGEGAILVSDTPDGPFKAKPNTDTNNAVEVKEAERDAGFASPGQEIVAAGEGAILLSKVPEGPIDTDPNANKAAQEEPIRKEEGSSPAVEEVVKEVLPSATFAAPVQIIEEAPAETPLMEKEEAPKSDGVSAVEEKEDDTLRNVDVDEEKSSNEIYALQPEEVKTTEQTLPKTKDEFSKEETVNSGTNFERKLPETADESSKEETFNPSLCSGETRNEEMKKPEQTFAGENGKTEAGKPEQKLPDEMSNEEKNSALASSGDSVKEDKKTEATGEASKEEKVHLVKDPAENAKEDDKKSETADRVVENENEEVKEPETTEEASVVKTVTPVMDTGENKKQVEKTDRELPAEDDTKEITETKAVDEAPKQEIPPAKQSKQSNNLMSKVKHSMGKVKKAILGKSPSSKSSSTVGKNEINVK